ncbi:site-specific integrase [Aerococcaceae bacterium zg-B36]|uniref:site-specific integrase n=1 Tax=Aerococcaceae bacterium zg-252 TaxID=2796928 RepID=UPI001BD8918C|nr:site-specific integrase [Aerococcaceae bacterium zg-B36]
MIKEYTKKDGSKAYMFVAYLGVDPITGKQKRTTRRGFKTKREAKIAEAKLQSEVEENGFNIKEKVKFQEVYESWLVEHKATVKPASFRATMNYARLHILPIFGHIHIDKIDIFFCQKVVHKWAEKYESTSHMKIVVQQVLDYAIKIRLIKDNPMRLVKLPKIHRREKNNQFYTKEELKTFLDCAKVYNDGQYLPFFRLLSFTGMRKGEALALTWDDINLKEQTISINKGLSLNEAGRPMISTTKTKASVRTISIDTETLKILSEWKIKQRKQLLYLGYNAMSKKQLVFSNNNNQLYYPMVANEWLNKIIKCYNLKRITVHGFRHTHCSLLFDIDTPLQIVQERLGHSDIKITMNIYTHVTERKRDEYADKFASYINF